MATSPYARQQATRMQRINDSYTHMHMLVLILSLSLGIVTAMLVHFSTGSEYSFAAFLIYVFGIAGGLFFYSVLVRVLIGLVGNLVKMAGEPIRIRDSQGRFIKLNKDGKPIGYVDIPHLNGEERVG